MTEIPNEIFCLIIFNYRTLLGIAVFLEGAPHVAALVVVGVLASSISRATMPDWLDSVNARVSRAVHGVGERTPLLA